MQSLSTGIYAAQKKGWHFRHRPMSDISC